MVEAVVSRPHMPGYGVLGPEEGSGLLAWSWAEERLVRSHDYWVATVRPGGGPHVMPVWGVWIEGAALFSSSGQSRKARNIAADARVVITTDTPSQPVIVEGTAQRVRDVEAVEAFTGWVNDKYHTDLPVSFLTANACFCVEPLVVFALDEDDFTGTPTRWVFGAAR